MISSRPVPYSIEMKARRSFKEIASLGARREITRSMAISRPVMAEAVALCVAKMFSAASASPRGGSGEWHFYVRLTGVSPLYRRVIIMITQKAAIKASLIGGVSSRKE